MHREREIEKLHTGQLQQLREDQRDSDNEIQRSRDRQREAEIDIDRERWQRETHRESYSD